jgi:hypothetical protein
MQKQETLSYQEQFKDAVVSLSPFVCSSTGIFQSQTSIKIDTYTLACVPYQLSMNRAVLIGAFTKDEIIFFQRFKNGLAGLTLTVQTATAREPEKIFCRCQVSAIGAMRGRDGVGLIVCEFKPIPPALAEILGLHIQNLERIKSDWETLKGRSVSVNPENSRKLGFNNYAVMTCGAETLKLALFSLSTDRLEFLLPLKSPDIAVGTSASFNLFFQKYRFAVAGKVESSIRLPTGVQRIRAIIEFSAELCDILSSYFFSATVAARR